jgi:hypothetical protein
MLPLTMPAIPLAAAGEILDRLRPLVLFSDIDGTLVGRGGSLLAGFDGTPTLAAATALLAAHEAELDLVLVSGRPSGKLREVGRVLGIHDAIAELGTVLMLGGETELLWGEVPRDIALSTPRSRPHPRLPPRPRRRDQSDNGTHLPGPARPYGRARCSYR